MTDAPQGPSAPLEQGSGRLDSWKEIAAYLRRDVKTVQRWEKREGMPVHRHLHDKMGSVYAFRNELDGWAHHRRLTMPADGLAASPDSGPSSPAVDDLPAEAQSVDETQSGKAWPAARIARARWLWALAAGGAVLALGLAALLYRPGQEVGSPIANARFLPLTDFPGIEQAAAISRDGKLAAFLSDRDGQMDVWVTQIGSGEFHNLTRGSSRDVVNPAVRTIGFSPDGTLVTFWARRLDAAQQSEISIWGVPILGGSPRVYLDGVAEYDWSGDAGRLVYHTPGPGDPTLVRGAGKGTAPTQIFSAPTGLHGHFQLWSPDGAFIYFVQGSVPDRMDLWRMTSSGASLERITNHDSAVTYPVFVSDRTLLYLATDRDGSGPWIYSVDVVRRVPRRASLGLDRYTSLAASADGRRVVATLASPKNTLWRLPIGTEPTRAADARAIALTTGNGSSPRAGNGFLLYVSPKGTGDSIWKLEGSRASELWSLPETRVIGGPALARDGQRIAFCTRRLDGQTSLWVANSDGTGARTLVTSFELQGTPAWTPDGQAFTVAGLVDGVPSLFSVPVGGSPPVRLMQEQSIDPAWSPDGDVLVFSGADVGTTFPLKAVTADGHPYPMREMTLSRGARRVVFLGGKRSLVVLRGELHHKNLWAIDLETGAERQLTDFAPDFDIRDFDVAPDGSEIVLEQTQEHSDIVLLELPR